MVDQVTMYKRSIENGEDLLKDNKRARLDVEEARRLEESNAYLRQFFARGRKEAAEERRKRDTGLIPYPFVKPQRTLDLKEQKFKPLSLEESKKYEEQVNEIREIFKKEREKEILEKEQREKEYEPITRAIKEHKPFEQKQYKPSTDVSRFKRTKVVFRPRAMSTPTSKHFDLERPRPEDVPLPPSISSEEETELLEESSLHEYVDKRNSELGPIAKLYLPNASDRSFGIYYDLGDQTLKIGHTAVKIQFDDIVLTQSNLVYKGTPGLWKLLTTSTFIHNDEYTSDDFEKYKEILIKTDALYHNNDPTSGHPKSSKGHKWLRLVKPIWDQYKLETVGQVTGEGLEGSEEESEEEQTNSGNFKKLIDLLTFIEKREVGGLNNFHDEKLSVVKSFCSSLEKLVTKPNGLKYVIRCLSVLPENIE